MMDSGQRRQAILDALGAADQPVSASALSRRFGVSRQIVVGDVALLRAGGAEISATPRGYVLGQTDSRLLRTVACRHTAGEMEAELRAMVDNGCTVVDVIVDHPVYGQLTGPLRLSSRYDVGQFMERCRQAEAQPLSLLTEGIHLHTLACPDEDAYRRTLAALRQLGVLLEP